MRSSTRRPCGRSPSADRAPRRARAWSDCRWGRFGECRPRALRAASSARSAAHSRAGPFASQSLLDAAEERDQVLRVLLFLLQDLLHQTPGGGVVIAEPAHDLAIHL